MMMMNAQLAKVGSFCTLKLMVSKLWFALSGNWVSGFLSLAVGSAFVKVGGSDASYH